MSEITGVLVTVFDRVEVNAKFTKREFVVEHFQNKPEYKEMTKFELVQDACDRIEGYKVGDMITVSYNLRGRKWTDPEGVDKYFNTVNAWKVEKSGQAEVAAEVAAEVEEGNDLPF